MKLITLLLFLIHPISHARSLGGLNIPQTRLCGGKVLSLKGAGLRTATIFDIKIYVVAIYAETPIINKRRPLCFDITYLRDFDETEVDKAWAFQIRESADIDYPGRMKDIRTLQKMFGKIEGMRTQRLELLNGTTRVFENDELKGEIAGENFQRSFISVWAGKKPPTKELQSDLLKTLSFD